MDHRYSVAINVWHKYSLSSVRRYLKSKQGQLRAAIVAQLVKSVCLKPRGAQFESLHRRVQLCFQSTRGKPETKEADFDPF